MGNGGRREGAGRKAGVPNKMTTQLKEAILAAADAAGGDGGMVGYLTTLATANTSAFAALLGKVLPHTIAGDRENPLKFENVSDAKRKAAVALLLAKSAE